ncbi:MAG: hypothetical protein U0R26_10655 [Solirubrobacterales bacterium]
MRKECAILAVVLAVSIAVPGVATAETGFRSGAPALDQYVETLPDAGGDKPANHSGDGGSSVGTDSGDTYSSGTTGTTATSSAPASSIAAPRPPSSELSKLRASGSDGGATANAIEAISGGAAISGAGSGSSGGTGSDLLPLDSADGDSPFAGVVSVLTGGGPGGPALPAVLLTVLAGGIFLGTRGLGRGRGSGNRR